MKSYPFTSRVTYDSEGLPLYDRAVDSTFLRTFYAAYWSDGVFYTPATALQVTAGTSGMTVQVAPGMAQIQGAFCIETATRTLVVQAAESDYDRIDTVVLRLDLSLDVRSIDLYVLEGTPAETPAAPALTQNATIWELGLANVFVAKNTTTVTQQRITDTRLDTTRCGVVAQTVGELDTSAYFAQLTAAIAAYDEEAAAAMEKEAAQFTTWFDGIKGQLSTDAAGNLQNEIDTLDDKAEGFVDRVTVFGTDGKTITETSGTRKKVTAFADDGTITTKQYEGSTLINTETVTFSTDGLTITEEKA